MAIRLWETSTFFTDISKYIFWDQKIYFEISVVWNELKLCDIQNWLYSLHKNAFKSEPTQIQQDQTISSFYRGIKKKVNNAIVWVLKVGACSRYTDSVKKNFLTDLG